MYNISQLAAKAQSLKIILKPRKNNKPQHYTLIFQQIPYYTKDHRLLYSELIFNDCTTGTAPLSFLSDPSVIKIDSNTYLIDNLQSYISKHSLDIQYHEQPSTTTLFTITFPEGD